MMRCAAVTAVVVLAVTARASAQPGLAPPAPEAPAPPAPRVVSPLEAGSLGRGKVAARIGVGLGNGPLGLGGELAVGLGGVDLLASLGYLPQFCLDLGDLGGGCDPTQVFVGLGAQAKLGETGPVRFGARVKGDASVAGDRVRMIATGVDASTGSAAVRVSVGAVVAGWSEEDDPFGDNGFYAGPEVGVSYLRANAGGALTFGYGFPLQGQPEPLPIVSATAIWR